MALARRMQLMVIHILLMFWLKTARAHDKEEHGTLRMKTVSVYLHDILYVTSVLVAEPSPKGGAITPTEAPFGALFLSNDKLTEAADPASARLGNGTVTWFSSTPDYGTTTMTTWVLTFFNNSTPPNHELHGLHGTLTACGITSVNDPEPQPITGGTGSFAFVVGSLTHAVIDASTFNVVLRLDLRLFWPPYAPTATAF